MKTKNNHNEIKKYFSNVGLGNEKQILLENLAMLMEAGIGIQSALESLLNETRSTRLKRVIVKIQNGIENGKSFSSSVEDSGLLPDYVVTLIRIGEDSGNLTENLSVINKQQEKDNLFKSKLKTAMLYPFIVFGLAIVIGMGIAWFILPRLATLFHDLKVELPLPTKILINSASFMHSNGSIMVVVLGIVVVSVTIATIFSRRLRDFPLQIAYHSPVLGNLIKQIELARFGYISGSLLEAGLPIVDVFKSLSSASRIYKYKKFYLYMADKIDEGESFKIIFSKYKNSNKMIPRPLQELIVAGEQSGKLASMLARLGIIYEEKIENTSKNLATLLEPVMLVFVWLMVVGIALAVILPIYKLIGGLN